MYWWQKALYDTCSLITLDKLWSEQTALEKYFPSSLLALGESFSADQMRPETASRLKHQVTIHSLPPPTVLSAIFRTAKLSKALAQVDKYLYATAVHCRLAVVTGDRRLGQAVQKAQLPVADMAIVLCHLVSNQHITPSQCDSLLKALVGQCEFLLGHQEPTWENLKHHKFP